MRVNLLLPSCFLSLLFRSFLDNDRGWLLLAKRRQPQSE